MRISKDDVVPYEPRSWAWGDSITVNVRLWLPDPPDDPPKRGARTEFLDFETVRVTVAVTTTIRHIDLEEP